MFKAESERVKELSDEVLSAAVTAKREKIGRWSALLIKGVRWNDDTSPALVTIAESLRMVGPITTSQRRMLQLQFPGDATTTMVFNPNTGAVGRVLRFADSEDITNDVSFAKFLGRQLRPDPLREPTKQDYDLLIEKLQNGTALIDEGEYEQL